MAGHPVGRQAFAHGSKLLQFLRGLVVAYPRASAGLPNFPACKFPRILELRPGKPRSIDDERVAELIQTTLHSKPTDGATHWSIRSLAAETGISGTSVHRYIKLFGLQPHRSESFKLSTDPFFLEKLRDVVGLYLNPPDKALVLCVDEKSQVQALERTQPLLPMGFGYVEGVTHDYKRHGTTTLFAALDVLTGQVLAECKPRHRHQEFLRFLRAIEAAVPADLDVHMIVDNYPHAQACQGQGMAGRSSSLASALRANLQLVAQPGRTLFRSHHRSCHPPRLLPLGARIDSAHRSLCGPSQRRLQTFHLDHNRRFDHRQARKTLCTNQRNGTQALAGIVALCSPCHRPAPLAPQPNIDGPEPRILPASSCALNAARERMLTAKSRLRARPSLRRTCAH